MDMNPLSQIMTVLVTGKDPEHLDSGQPVRTLSATPEERKSLQELHLITAKPVMYIANVSDDGFENNPYLDAVKQRAEGEGAVVVPVCAAIEEELIELDADEAKEFLDELGLEEPGLNRVIRAGYKLLGLQTYFTAGPKEVRAWTVPIGATAPQAAGVIHSDFERGFIRAEVVAFDDFVARRFPDLSMYFGGVQAVSWHPDRGFEGAADPRRDPHATGSRRPRWLPRQHH